MSKSYSMFEYILALSIVLCFFFLPLLQPLRAHGPTPTGPLDPTLRSWTPLWTSPRLCLSWS